MCVSPFACFAVRLPRRSDNLASFMSVNREEEEQPFESLEEIEARTIGNLLPDEDDFFAGVVGDVGRNSRLSDIDDFDLFSSVGGMELDGDVFSTLSQRDGKRSSNVSVSGEFPEGEVLLSRTLFVRNMDSIIEDCDLRVLFEVLILWQKMLFLEVLASHSLYIFTTCF